MNYQITSDNIEVSESMKALGIEKFQKIEKRLTPKEKDEALVRIVMNKSSPEEKFEVKINLTYGKKKYFAEESDNKLETALIEVVGEIERMRRKDDIAYYADWKKQREVKRSIVEDLEPDDETMAYKKEDFDDPD